MEEYLTIDVPVVVGFIGVGFLIFAYFLIASGKAKGSDIRYHVLNLLGAVFLLYSLMFRWNLPTVIIECIWITISLYGIWRALKLRKKTDASTD